MELFNFLSDTLGVSSMCLLCLVCSSKILTIDVSTGKVNWLLTCQYLPLFYKAIPTKVQPSQARFQMHWFSN
jgi:hypothetical protein